MRVVLARVVARVALTLAPGVEVKPVQRGFTVAPSNGVPVRVQRRARPDAASALDHAR